MRRSVGDFVRSLIERGIATAVHDLSDGGLAVGLAEMAMASGIGAEVVRSADFDPIPQFFGEDQGRYLVTVDLDPDGDEIEALWAEAKALGIFAPWIGTTGRRRIETRRGACDISGRAQGRPRIVVPPLHGQLSEARTTKCRWMRTTSRS